MNLELTVLWLLVGWIGQHRTPGFAAAGVYMLEPEGVYVDSPFRKWLQIILTSVIGGVGGGMLYNSLWPIDFSAPTVGIAVAASALGAFVGVRVLDNLLELGAMILGLGSPR